MSGSFEPVRWNACVQRLDLGVYSHPKKCFGNGVRTHVNPRGKSPLPEKISPEEDRTHDAASNRTASPTHYQRAASSRTASPTHYQRAASNRTASPTHYQRAASNRTASPTHYQRAASNRTASPTHYQRAASNRTASPTHYQPAILDPLG